VEGGKQNTICVDWVPYLLVKLAMPVMALIHVIGLCIIASQGETPPHNYHIWDFSYITFSGVMYV